MKQLCAMRFEPRQGRLGREGVAFGWANRESAGNPKVLLALRPGFQLFHQVPQFGAAVIREEPAEVSAENLAGRATEGLFRRGIDPPGAELPIQFDDGVHGAIDEPVELLLAVAEFGFARQTLKFGGGPRSKNTEDRQHPRVLGKRPTIDNRHVPEDLAIRRPEAAFPGNSPDRSPWRPKRSETVR